MTKDCYGFIESWQARVIQPNKKMYVVVARISSKGHWGSAKQKRCLQHTKPCKNVGTDRPRVVCLYCKINSMTLNGINIYYTSSSFPPPFKNPGGEAAA